MSYILDALRRADAERERGHVPGLHSHAVAGSAPAPGTTRAAWPWWTAGALAIAGAVAIWLSVGRSAPATVAQPAAAAPPVAAVAPAPSPPVAIAPAPVAPPPRAAEPRAKVRAEPASQPEASPVVAFEKLPPEVRQQLPTLAIGGAIYSDQAASRMLIVGGQLLREGDTVAPGVKLERIKPRAAVLRWKDVRYEVSF